MGVIQVIPGSAIQPWGGELDERGNSRYQETWTVITDDPNDGPLVVSNAAGLPARYSSYSRGNDVDLLATLKRIQVRRRADTLKVWDIDYEWDTANESPDHGDPNPLARRREKQWTASPYEMPVNYDLFGSPILNAASDEFDPPAMRNKFGLRLTYTRNLATEAEVATCFGYLNTVNNDTFQGFVPGAACCVDVSATEEFDEKMFFWKTTMVFEFRQVISSPGVKIHPVNSFGAISSTPVAVVYPWNLTLANVGFYEVVSGAKKRITDGDNKPVVQPVRLFANGTKIPIANPRSDTVYLTWQIFEYRPFAPLGIV